MVAGSVVAASPRAPTRAIGCGRPRRPPTDAAAVDDRRRSPRRRSRRRGRSRVTGTVTNTDDETWRSINVYAFISDAADDHDRRARRGRRHRPVDAVVGERITDPGTYDDDRRARTRGVAGRSPSRVRRASCPRRSPASTGSGCTRSARQRRRPRHVRRRPGPHVPAAGAPRTEAPVGHRVVVPVRRRRPARRRRRSATSRLDRRPRRRRPAPLPRRLRRRGRRPAVTWLVDPAVLDAVRRLVAGNPPRSLGRRPSRRRGRARRGESDGRRLAVGARRRGARPTRTSPTEPRGRRSTPPPSPASSGWTGFEDAVADDDEVLALPYGDLDVAAAAATRRTSTSCAAVAAAPHRPARDSTRSLPWRRSPTATSRRRRSTCSSGDETVILSDRPHVGRGPGRERRGRRPGRPGRVQRGHARGPGSGRPARSPIAMRQRLLTRGRGPVALPRAGPPCSS